MGIKEYFSNKYGKKQNQEPVAEELGLDTVADMNTDTKASKGKQKEPTQAQLQRAIAYLASMWKGTKEQFVEFIEEHKSTIKRFAVGTIGFVMLLFLTGCRAGVEFEAWLDLDGERPGVHEKGEMPSQEIGKPGTDGDFYFGGGENDYVGEWVGGSDVSTDTGRNPSDTYGDQTGGDTYVGEWVGDGTTIDGGSLIIGSTVDVETNTQYIIIENNVVVEGDGNTIIITNGGDTNVITPENNMTIVIRDKNGNIIGVYENGVYTPVTENVGEKPGGNGGDNGGTPGGDNPGTGTPGGDTGTGDKPSTENKIPSNLCYVDLLATYFRGREAHVESITVAEDPNNEVDAVDMNFRGKQGKWVTWICKMTDGTTMNLTISLENNHLVNGGNTTGLVGSAGVHADGDGTNFEAAAKAALASWGVSPEFVIQQVLGGEGMGMGH